jgi:hypothetical protein
MFTKNAFGYNQFKQYLESELTRLQTLHQQVREKIYEVQQIKDLPMSTLACMDIDKVLTDVKDSFKTEKQAVYMSDPELPFGRFIDATKTKQEVI